jgi:hypothetical protein
VVYDARPIDAAAPDAMGGDANPDCVVGNLSDPIQVQVVTENLAPITSTLPLTFAPQGGYIALVGVRVKNANICGQVQAALIDPSNGGVLGIEARDITWNIAADGFAEPAQPDQLGDFVNLALCPNAALTADLDGNPYTLEVRVSGSTTDLTVTPTCPADATCTCECAKTPTCAAN